MLGVWWGGCGADSVAQGEYVAQDELLTAVHCVGAPKGRSLYLVCLLTQHSEFAKCAVMRV